MENQPPNNAPHPGQSAPHVRQTPEHHVNVPQGSEESRNVPNGSERFHNVPHTSEPFRSVPHTSETFRNVPNDSDSIYNERKQSHAITVREAARMFEDAGVARTERSITNWCRRDASGLARLDAYYDPNERRYYITEESITRTISEEKAKAFRTVPNGAEAVPNASAGAKDSNQNSGTRGRSEADATDLSEQLLDLRILNAGKDMVIKQLREERDKWIQQLMAGSKRIGELETRLLQSEEPLERKLESGPGFRTIPKRSESDST